MLVKIEQEGGVKSIKIAEASDGLNAYQLAVKNDGFVGDYDAWKVTLKGDQGLDAFEVWEVSNPGGTLAQYNAFIKGVSGNDANVTSANIATALGYTPADDASVTSTENRVTALEGAAAPKQPVTSLWNTGDPLSFSLQKAPSQVDINGVLLTKWLEDGVTPDEYSIVGTTVTLSVAPANGSIIQFHFGGSSATPINSIGYETDLLKINQTIDGSRTTNGGDVFNDASYFRTVAIPVTEGKRYASVSSSVGSSPRYAFYNSATTNSGSLVSISVSSRSATVPVGAKYMIFAALQSLKSSYILLQMDSDSPILGQDTFKNNLLYTKTEVDFKFNNLDVAEWYPETFELDIISTISDSKVLHISDNDTLYGTNGYRDIFKATNVDLSDSLVVCTLPSLSSLKKLLFVSTNKAVGYVISSGVEADTGFYCFDNADTNTWTARRISKMRAGYPKMEFQSLVKTPDSSHLFAASYGDKVTDPSDLTTQAPVDVYRSTDLGETWQIVYTHPTRINQHTHALEWDKYRDRLWVCVGDEDPALGAVPGWAYSDDYGTSWGFVENNDVSGQIPFMDTAIIPTRKYVLFGSDFHPAGIRKWEPSVDGKNEVVSNVDVDDSFYLVPIEQTDNFGFAKNPIVDISAYPYKIGMAISHNAAYSKSCVLLSPNFKDWYMLDLVNDPINNVSWSSFSGITSDGWVLGWCTLTADGKQYYRRFKYPNWIKN